MARGAGDYAGEMADKAVDAIGPAADKIAAATQAAIDKATEAIRRATAGMKKDDGVTDAEVVAEEPPDWKPPAAEPSLRRTRRRPTRPDAVKPAIRA